MPKFKKETIDELSAFLHDFYYVHDAKLETIKYENNSLQLGMFNSYYNKKMNMLFLDIEMIFAIKGNEIGGRDVILSLTVEQESLLIKSGAETSAHERDNALCLVFQMFSGDELHVFCNEIVVEEENIKD